MTCAIDEFFSAYNLPAISAIEILRYSHIKWPDESRQEFSRSQKQYSESLGLQEVLHLLESRRSLSSNIPRCRIFAIMSQISSFRRLKRHWAVVEALPLDTLYVKYIYLCTYYVFNLSSFFAARWWEQRF